jgi:hypothetical protein
VWHYSGHKCVIACPQTHHSPRGRQQTLQSVVCRSSPPRPGSCSGVLRATVCTFGYSRCLSGNATFQFFAEGSSRTLTSCSSVSVHARYAGELSSYGSRPARRSSASDFDGPDASSVFVSHSRERKSHLTKTERLESRQPRSAILSILQRRHGIFDFFSLGWEGAGMLFHAKVAHDRRDMRR